jgi:microfibrillar-associated protein 1
MSSRTKSTKPLRPVARYRRGQAPANAGLDSESSDEGQEEPGEDGNREEEEEEEEENKVERGSKGKETGRTMAITLKEVEIDAQGSVRVGGREEVGKTGRELEDEEGMFNRHLDEFASCVVS